MTENWSLVPLADNYPQQTEDKVHNREIRFMIDTLVSRTADYCNFASIPESWLRNKEYKLNDIRVYVNKYTMQIVRE